MARAALDRVEFPDFLNDLAQNGPAAKLCEGICRKICHDAMAEGHAEETSGTSQMKLLIRLIRTTLASLTTRRLLASWNTADIQSKESPSPLAATLLHPAHARERAWMQPHEKKSRSVLFDESRIKPGTYNCEQRSSRTRARMPQDIADACCSQSFYCGGPVLWFRFCPSSTIRICVCHTHARV